MCFSPKMPPAPKPIEPPTREDAGDMADRAVRKRKSTSDGYANWAIATSQSGVKDFGKAAQVPSLSAGGAQVTGA